MKPAQCPRKSRLTARPHFEEMSVRPAVRESLRDEDRADFDVKVTHTCDSLDPSLVAATRAALAADQDDRIE